MIDYQAAWCKLRGALEDLRDHYEVLERAHPSAVSTARAEAISVALAYMDLAYADQETPDTPEH